MAAPDDTRRDTGQEEALRAERDYYRHIAEQTGRKLLAGFNEMSRLIGVLRNTEDALRRAGEDLERKVAERTADVERSNEELRAQIDERARAEAEARESAALYRLLTETSPDAITVVDPVGNILMLNSQALDLFGHFDAAEVQGRPFLDWVPEDWQQIAFEAFTHLFTEDVVRGVEVELQRQNGQRFWAVVNGSLVRDDQGEPSMGILVSRDISAQKRAEAELLKTQKLESVGLLAGGIAHDFNNLLTTIVGNINLVRQMSTSEAVIDCLREAEMASLRARDLTQQLLTFSRGGQPVKKPLGLATPLREAAQFAVSGTSVRCDLRIARDLLVVEADEGQIVQVVNNLVINAAQAMPDGGTCTIEANNVVVAENADGLVAGRYVRIRVSDTGVGIPHALWPRLFDPYFTTKTTGTGLGLAVAYAVVRNHGGTIHVTSELGVGSVFTVYLPASDHEVVDEVGVVTASEAQPGRVLVMDDDAGVRAVAAKLLGSMGCVAVTARDGAEAIAAFDEARRAGEPFDLLIVDLTVPGGMGGREAFARIREIDPHATAIVSSGYADNTTLSEYQAHGFSAVLAKPYTLAALRRAVAEALDARHRR